MTERIPSKDEALEALDFIVNVLKEHEKDLDKLIEELGTVAEQIGDTGELASKADKIEQKITVLQAQIENLIKNTPNLTPLQTATTTVTEQIPQTPQTTNTIFSSPSLVLQCKQWQDFQTLAKQANIVTFILSNAEKTIEANAIKNNQIIKYTGETPKLQDLLKTWLSKQLQTSENNILEGTLAPT